MKALLVEMELHWGFSVRKPRESAAQETFLYPPPSTLIGVLARGYAKLKGLCELVRKGEGYYSSAVVLLDSILYAAASIKGGAIAYQDISRNVAAVFKKQEHRGKPEEWFAVQAMGRVYAPKGRLLAVYLLRSCEEDLVQAALGATSVGSKEGIVSVLDVKLVNAELVEEDFVDETPFYVPREAASSYDKSTGVEVEFWDVLPEVYKYPQRSPPKPWRFIVPAQPRAEAIHDIEVSEQGAVVLVEGDYLVVPRKLVEQGEAA